MSHPAENTLSTKQLTIEQIAAAIEATPADGRERQLDLDGVPLTYSHGYHFDIYEITADSYAGFCCVRVKIDDRGWQWVAYDHDRTYQPKRVFSIHSFCQGAIADALRFAGKRANWR